MRRGLTALLALALCSGLAACVPDPSVNGAGLATPPAGKTDDGAYVARKDGAFSIPAIPLEKLPPEYRRQTVVFQTDEAPGTIIINPGARYLHFVTGKNKAIRYGIAVGKAGFEWSGVANVTDRKQWPTWTPPPEMIARKPELLKFEKGQPGGLTNPLGARALYLTSNGVDYGYRIHGTPEWQSIGSNASSGCIRMINQDVIDLFSRVPAGAKVIVLNADGSMPSGLKLPPPAPKVKKPVLVVKTAEPVMPVLPATPPLNAALIGPAPAVLPLPVVPPAAVLPAVGTAVVTPAAGVPPAGAAPAAIPPVCGVALVAGVCPKPAL